VFNAPRKSTATHHPEVDVHAPILNISEQDSDFPQRPILIFITYGHQKCGWVAQIILPGRLRQTLAVEIKLIGLIDQLERARRQTSGRMTLMGQLFGQAQDIVTVASFVAGFIFYAPWLIALLLLALVPAFLGEAHFNAQSYSLDFGRTPERRELDYVRQTAASVETAKEVKIFGLNGFLIDRYVRLATNFYAANRRLAMRRAGWGGLFTAIGTVGYYLAYAYIAWRTLAGEFSVGDLTFLAGSFRRLRTLLEGLLTSFSTTASQAR